MTQPLLHILWAVLLYASLALTHRILRKRVVILSRTTIAMNILFLLLAVDLFLSEELSRLHTSAVDLNQVALRFMSVYLAMRLLDYYIFELILSRRQRAPVPIVLRDIGRWILSTVALFLIIRMYFPNLDLNVLAISSIVVGYILGNATQDTLGNLVSGLALNTANPFAIGDWISVDGHTGQIVDMTWRATRLRTKMDDFVTIPNATISREAITNHSRPSDIHGSILNVGVNYEVSPETVRTTILDALGEVPDVLSVPEPLVWLDAYNDFSVDYKIKFFSRKFEKLESIQSRIMDLIWYHFKRNGIVIPFPIRNVNMRQITRDEDLLRAQETLAERTKIISGIDLFQPLSERERQTLASSVREEVYAPGEAILRQGEDGSTFYILTSGQVDVSVRQASRELNVTHLAAGSFFGEMSFLTGEKRNATITVSADCTVLVLSHAILSRILESNVKLAEEFALILEQRQKSAAGRFAQDNLSANNASEAVSSSVLLSRIRSFFGLDKLRGT